MVIVAIRKTRASGCGHDPADMVLPFILLSTMNWTLNVKQTREILGKQREGRLASVLRI